MEAKKVLAAAHGDRAEAIKQLRQSGLKIAAAKSHRAVKEGAVGFYLHANGKVGALVAVACETDFVARTDDFKELAHDLALHIAAMNPAYLSADQIPVAVIEQERAIYRAQLRTEGKPEKMWNKIIEGKLEKFYREVCFLQQPYVKDDSQTIAQRIQTAIAKLGENIQVTSFSRLTI